MWRPGRFTSHVRALAVLDALLLNQILANTPGRQQMMPQGLESLSIMWENWVEFLAPVFGLALSPSYCGHLGSGLIAKSSLSLSLFIYKCLWDTL